MKRSLENLRCRSQTYKTHEQCRRSFYRWICKRELYGNLFIIHHGKWTFHQRYIEKYNFGGVGFRRGYPSFEASRSEARNQWNREFDVHRERFEAEWRLRYDQEQKRLAEIRDSQRRVNLVGDRNTRRFFRMLSVG